MKVRGGTSQSKNGEINYLEKASTLITRSLEPMPALLYVDETKVIKGMDFLRKKTDLCYSNFAKQVTRDQKFVSPERSMIDPSKFYEKIYMNNYQDGRILKEHIEPEDYQRVSDLRDAKCL